MAPTTYPHLAAACATVNAGPSRLHLTAGQPPAHRARETQAYLAIQATFYSWTMPQPIVPGKHKLTSPSRLHLTAGQCPSLSCQGNTSLPRHPGYILQQDNAPAHRARETQVYLAIQATSYSRTMPRPIVPGKHKLTSPSRLHLVL
ncbi:hypothetical protein PoB_003913900 [Plakobranchus ocellatus]|uniref:Transposase n=1 Tax=Plakobranchus ocellatus TaxID=259542 RepID=A0AAV4AXY6_9GAST|nr:hypothetical protein PoB_003913900 [Plakobranchus ocellatus]